MGTHCGLWDQSVTGEIMKEIIWNKIKKGNGERTGELGPHFWPYLKVSQLRYFLCHHHHHCHHRDHHCTHYPSHDHHCDLWDICQPSITGRSYYRAESCVGGGSLSSPRQIVYSVCESSQNLIILRILSPYPSQNLIIRRIWFLHLISDTYTSQTHFQF